MDTGCVCHDWKLGLTTVRCILHYQRNIISSVDVPYCGDQPLATRHTFTDDNISPPCSRTVMHYFNKHHDSLRQRYIESVYRSHNRWMAHSKHSIRGSKDGTWILYILLTRTLVHFFKMVKSVQMKLPTPLILWLPDIFSMSKILSDSVLLLKVIIT